MGPLDVHGEGYRFPARREYHAKRPHRLQRPFDGYPGLKPVSFRVKLSPDDAGQVLWLDMPVLSSAQDPLHDLFEILGHGSASTSCRSSWFQFSLDAHGYFSLAIGGFERCYEYPILSNSIDIVNGS